jgi:hypothetical protein
VAEFALASRIERCLCTANSPIGLEGVCLKCDYFRFAVPSMNWVRFLVPVSMVTDRMSG